MRILIVGGGGLGTVLAGFLARAGEDVTLFVKAEQAAAMARPEVRVGGLQEFTAPAKVTSDAAGLGAFAYLIVCVKTRDTEAALGPLHAVSFGCALSLQNGVEKDDVLAGLLGRDRVLGAVTAVGGALQTPGYALHTLAGATMVGELDGSVSERGERIAAAIRDSGLPASCIPNIVTHEWYKLAGYLRTAPISALTRLDVARFAADPDLGGLSARITLDAARVAEAEGHPLWRLAGGFPAFSGGAEAEPAPSDAAPWNGEEIRAGLRMMGEHLRARGIVLYPSLAQDTIAGKPTELEATAGDVVHRADRHGLAVPALATVTALLRGMERAAE